MRPLHYSPPLAVLAFLVALGCQILAPGAYPAPQVLAAEPCGSVMSLYNPGKTAEGFKAKATDGCHTVEWTSNTTDMVEHGKTTFKTIGNVDPWDAAYTLPKIENGYCEYRAAHEANGWMTNKFKVPPGTEVTVVYDCY